MTLGNQSPIKYNIHNCIKFIAERNYLKLTMNCKIKNVNNFFNWITYVIIPLIRLIWAFLSGRLGSKRHCNFRLSHTRKNACLYEKRERTALVVVDASRVKWTNNERVRERGAGRPLLRFYSSRAYSQCTRTHELRAGREKRARSTPGRLCFSREISLCVCRPKVAMHSNSLSGSRKGSLWLR